jgi:hypothetical protein
LAYHRRLQVLTAHTVHLDPPLEVFTEAHGEGWALLFTDYGPGINAVWTIASKSDGRLRHYETIQVRLSANFTYGISPAQGRVAPAT